MGSSYRFRWPYPAEEVIVTGSFDGWGKRFKLENKGRYHELTVPLSITKEPIEYKYIVNGAWRVDPGHPVVKDHDGNENNILDPDDILTHTVVMNSVGPQATTTGLAGSQPTSDNLKGTLQDRVVGVNPIPATSGAGNPVDLKPGEPVPDPSTITDNTVQSTVKLDKETYEAGGAAAAVGVAGAVAVGAGLTFAAGHGPDTSASKGTFIPESSMSAGDYKEPTINSTGPQATSALLAGQQPIEPRQGPQVLRKEDDKDNEITTPAIIGGGAVAAGAPGAISSVGPQSTTADLAGQVPLEDNKSGPGGGLTVGKDQAATNLEDDKAGPGGGLTVGKDQSTVADLAGGKQPTVENQGPGGGLTAPKDQDGSSGSGLTTGEKVAGGAAAAGVVAAGAAVAANEFIKDKTGKDAVAALPQSTQDAINDKAKDSSIPNQAGVAAGNVPEEVKESQKEAGQAPEASANPEAVDEKSAAEKELLSKVPTTDAKGEPAPTDSAVAATTVPTSTSSTGAPQLGDPTHGGLAPISMDDKPSDAKVAAASTPATPNKSSSASPAALAAASAASHSDTTPAAKAKASQPETPQSTPSKRHSLVDRLKGTPESSSSSAAAAGGSPSSKKSKRRSFIERIKEKLKS